ncbi:hypothetical protein JTE90_026804 [Oedothorax gibbosus]|uniref:Cytochrome-b5 reductase n=1 Tax=Oedothorax gibbosus TaxID=931172 RepID=A0AAV6US44_9ARAC|nr:hypothetical protein JTE90_026804 [Oedothorax gibbosus]
MASDLGVPTTSNATGSGRTKVALRPGRSLMDWIRLTHSGRDLTSVGGRCLDVTPRELAKHNTKKDAWIAIRGRVYNVTHYMEYHPGGEAELMRGVGTDATDLFNQVHQWVNAESMLEKCFVGYLKKSWTFEVPKLPNLKNLKFKSKTALSPESPSNLTIASPVAISGDAIIPNGKECRVDAASPDLKIAEDVTDRPAVSKKEWSVTPSLQVDQSEELLRFENADGLIKLIISHSGEDHRGLIIDLVGRKCFLKISFDSTYIFTIEFPEAMKEDYKVSTEDKKVIEILFEAANETAANIDVQSFIQRIHWTTCELKDEVVYWFCKLVDKAEVNYNAFLFTFQLPSGTKMWVPIGQHIQVKTLIEGMEIVRSYTPVVSIPNSILKEDGSTIHLMIKVYPDGAVTPIINQCNIGESMQISNYVGSFSEQMLAASESVTLLAAGTGLTPMVKVIHWIMNAKDKNRCATLLFFNKKEDDILWRKELLRCHKAYDKFEVLNVLSEPDEEWTGGSSGRINEDLIKKFIPAPEIGHQVFVCGPLPFTETAIRCLENIGLTSNQVYAFTGS